MRTFAPVLILPLCLAATGGCQKKRHWDCPTYRLALYPEKKKNDPVVAEVNGRPILRSEVERRARHRSQTPREALGELIDEELLVQEAIRRGIHREPDTVHDGKRFAVYTFLGETFEKDFTRKDVPGTELRRAYTLNKRGRYVHPELRRFSHVQVARPWHRIGRKWVLDGERDRQARALMDEIRRQALATRPGSMQEFEALGRSFADRGFSLDTKHHELSRDRLNKAFADELWSLQKPGDISQVVKTRPRYHLIFLAEIRPAKNVPFAQVRQEILEKVWPDARKRAFKKLLESYRKNCPIEIHPEHLPVEVAPQDGDQ